MRILIWIAVPGLLAACATAPVPQVSASDFIDLNCAELAQSHYNTQIRISGATGKYYGDAFNKTYTGARGAFVNSEQAKFHALNTAMSRKGCERPPDFIPVSQTGGTASYWNSI